MPDGLRGPLVAGAIVAIVLPLVVPVLGFLLVSFLLAALAAVTGPEHP